MPTFNLQDRCSSIAIAVGLLWLVIKIIEEVMAFEYLARKYVIKLKLKKLKVKYGVIKYKITQNATDLKSRLTSCILGRKSPTKNGKTVLKPLVNKIDDRSDGTKKQS